jgi:hypothetical protein
MIARNLATNKKSFPPPAPPAQKKKPMIKSSNISPNFQCFFDWRIFAKNRPENYGFYQYKGFFMGKNGPNFEKKEKI